MLTHAHPNIQWIYSNLAVNSHITCFFLKGEPEYPNHLIGMNRYEQQLRQHPSEIEKIFHIRTASIFCALLETLSTIFSTYKDTWKNRKHTRHSPVFFMDHGVVVSKINKLGYEQKKHSSSWQGEATSNEPALLQQMMSPLFCCLSGGAGRTPKIRAIQSGWLDMLWHLLAMFWPPVTTWSWHRHTVF